MTVGGREAFLEVSIGDSVFSALLGIGASASLVGEQARSCAMESGATFGEDKRALHFASGWSGTEGSVHCCSKWRRTSRKQRLRVSPKLCHDTVLKRDFLDATSMPLHMGLSG